MCRYVRPCIDTCPKKDRNSPQNNPVLCLPNRLWPCELPNPFPSGWWKNLDICSQIPVADKRNVCELPWHCTDRANPRFRAVAYHGQWNRHRKAVFYQSPIQDRHQFHPGYQVSDSALRHETSGPGGYI